MEFNRTYLYDCVEGINKLINSNVVIDLVIADPPYVISRKSNFASMKDRKNSRVGTDFGDWDKEFNNQQWLESIYKVLKPGGSLLVFNDFKKSSIIAEICQKLGFIYKDTIIWQKTNPMPRNRDRRYAPDIEMLQWYVKPGGNWVFNRQDSTMERSVLKFPSESGGGFKRYHPTQKPVKLIEYLISIHSNKGDIILDPFMGSGTTGVASMNSDRSFIGFDIDEKYVSISNKRTMFKQQKLF